MDISLNFSECLSYANGKVDANELCIGKLAGLNRWVAGVAACGPTPDNTYNRQALRPHGRRN